MFSAINKNIKCITEAEHVDIIMQYKHQRQHDIMPYKSIFDWQNAGVNSQQPISSHQVL